MPPVYDWPQTIRPGDGAFYLLKEWTPENFNGKYSNERLTLFEGLRQSKNTVSVYLMKQLGTTEPLRNLMRNMGIDTDSRYPNGNLRVPEVPAICLGAVDLSVKEMVGAYTTFANNGTRTEPYLIQRIEDKNGTVLFQALPVEGDALPEKSNYVMVEMLRQSGKIGNQLYSDSGGKTGTTNDFFDAWFAGYTSRLSASVWIGLDQPETIFDGAYGGDIALPIWQDVMSEAQKVGLTFLSSEETRYPTELHLNHLLRRGKISKRVA
ncbi:MAG: penicillin-binding transpeptidase domain-containing protein, partial [Bacteroidota bacterium]